MDKQFRLKLKFWGVRGSIPTPARENMGYGGNTASLEIRLPGGDIVLIDGGTGLRNLGLSLSEEFRGKRLSLDMFLTHFHWDHIQGLPFFAPLFQDSNEITFYSTESPRQVEEIMEGQMSHPYFPVPFGFLSATRKFVQMEKRLQNGHSYSIAPFPLNHPQGATGYRIEANGAVIVHASDLEHGHARHDRTLIEQAEGADILIYDAQYTPEEYDNRRGWGHSTYVEAARVAKEAKVRQLVLFHHDPAHCDIIMDQILTNAARQFENTVAAREGLELIA